MVGIDQNIVFAITRLKTTFKDDIGNTESGIATGFWLSNSDAKGKFIFVTNKHNVDPKLIFGEDANLKLHSLYIELRKIEGKNICSETDFFFVKNLEDSLFVADTADCAIIIEPEFENLKDGYEPIKIPSIYELASYSFLEEKVHLMDTVSFIGFAGNKEVGWWDEEWNIPIARNASIASHSWKPFSNKNIKTKDVMLVSGLSFSGSSGSPVFLHQKGTMPSGKDYFCEPPHYVPPTIIGIMSGHWWDDEVNTPAMFKKHSGLSYFTTSRSILELINNNLKSEITGGKE